MIWDLVCGWQNDKIGSHEREPHDCFFLKFVFFFCSVKLYNVILLWDWKYVVIDAINYSTGQL